MCTDHKQLSNIRFDLRPISLMPMLAKILESLVIQWMLEKMCDQIDAQQFGAIKGHSTVHALTSTLQRQT